MLLELEKIEKETPMAQDVIKIKKTDDATLIVYH